MGRGDNRSTRKGRQRVGQKKKKERLQRKIEAGQQKK